MNKEDMCPDCHAFHGVPPLEHLEKGVPCGHDKEAACSLCGGRLGALSWGGPTICATCDTYGWPRSDKYKRAHEHEYPQNLKLYRYNETLDGISS